MKSLGGAKLCELYLPIEHRAGVIEKRKYIMFLTLSLKVQDVEADHDKALRFQGLRSAFHGGSE